MSAFADCGLIWWVFHLLILISRHAYILLTRFMGFAIHYVWFDGPAYLENSLIPGSTAKRLTFPKLDKFDDRAKPNYLGQIMGRKLWPEYGIMS
ncbi:MAG: hypothetical protein R3261_06995 [Alphaproteobacteria bacterium]|nr:hypothetical protein [Alphaproteobacteria bacterium]